MPTISSISSDFFKRCMLFYPSTSISPFHFCKIPKTKLTIAECGTQSRAFSPSRVMGLANGPSCMTEKLPPEIQTVPLIHEPAVPEEMPQRPNVPDFDPIPPENPTDPPPLSPGPNPGPEFPGPPDPLPPKPETPWPPIPSPPGEPDIVPPRGPDVVPPKPPEPGPPFPTQPDIPPPIMGSDGLVFY